jgi:hypothetical protein
MMITNWTRFGVYLSCLGAALSFLSESGSAAESGLLRAKLSVVQTGADFFRFFNFSPIGKEKLPDGTKVISFKPTGDAFRALVTLRVTTDDQGIIKKLDLAVARSFIDDPKKCVYAADLVKSFLTDAAATTEGDDVSLLAAEINARSMARSTTTVIVARPLPTTPGLPSAAYQTYAGSPQPQTLLYSSRKEQVLLRNDTQSSEPTLDIIVSATAGAA